MARPIPIKLYLALIYLSLLFLGGGYVYSNLQHFEGEVFLDQGAMARMVVRPAESTQALAPMQRNLPADALLPGNARHIQGRYGKDASVDVANLGFGLRLDAIKVGTRLPSVEELEIRGPGGTRSFDVTQGRSVDWDGLSVKMKMAQPWSGLVRSGGVGTPMAALELRGDGGLISISSILLHPKRWLWLGTKTAICFDWFATEAAALAAFPEALDATTLAYWEVRDGGTVHRASSFAPGTGFTLSDGTMVTLVAQRDGRGERSAALAVVMQEDGIDERVVVEANGDDSDARICYMAPGAAQETILVHGWRDMAGMVGVYHGGQWVGRRLLEEGEAWKYPGEAGYEIHLNQVMSQAVPVEFGEGDIRQLVVETEGGEINLRQGISVHVGAHQLIYHRRSIPPIVTYTCSVLPKDSAAASESFTLAPGTHRRVGAWRLSCVTDNPDGKSMAILRAERTLGGPLRLVGLALFVVGSFGLVVVRFRRG